MIIKEANGLWQVYKQYEEVIEDLITGNFHRVHRMEPTGFLFKTKGEALHYSLRRLEL